MPSHHGLGGRARRAVPVDQFRTLNRCLDNAIADAVTEFVARRDARVAIQHSAELTQKLGFLAHELRNWLQTATMAFTALESRKLSIAGSTGALLKRSLVALSALATRSLVEVRAAAGEPHKHELFALSSIVAEARDAASLDASSRGCDFAVIPIDKALAIRGDRDKLLSALTNLLQNAFKFTGRHTEVVLNAYAADDRVLIEVRDHCGGLPPGGALDTMFTPFTQRSTDRSGLGLGLSIARRNVEAAPGVVGYASFAATVLAATTLLAVLFFAGRFVSYVVAFTSGALVAEQFDIEVSGRASALYFVVSQLASIVLVDVFAQID